MGHLPCCSNALFQSYFVGIKCDHGVRWLGKHRSEAKVAVSDIP